MKMSNVLNNSDIQGTTINEEATKLDDFNDINYEKIKEFNENMKNNKKFFLRNFLIIGNEAFTKLEQKLDLMYDLFLVYSKLGEKVNDFKMNLNSFTKCLKDCEVVFTIKPSHNINNPKLTNLIFHKDKTATFSPVKTFGTERASSQSHTINIKTDFLNDHTGKIHEKDIPSFFYSLTGAKNFDNSKQNKAQFNKNAGFGNDIDMSNKSIVKIEKENLISASNKVVPLKMDFNLFLKSIEFLVKRLYPEKNLDDAYTYFIENDLKKAYAKRDNNETDKTFLTELLKSLRRDDIIELLKDIHPIIQPHYNLFSEPNQLMNFNGFHEFYKSFSLFPDIINLVKLKNLFFTLSELFDKFFFQEISEKSKQLTDIRVLQNPKNYINYSLFLDSLALTANISTFQENYSESEKVNIFNLDIIYN